MQKLFGSFLIVVSLVVAAIFVGSTITAEYQYTNSVGNYWTLADRASTIAQKSEYMDKFVAAFGDKNLAGVNDAIFFSNPDKFVRCEFRGVEELARSIAPDKWNGREFIRLSDRHSTDHRTGTGSSRRYAFDPQRLLVQGQPLLALE